LTSNLTETTDSQEEFSGIIIKHQRTIKFDKRAVKILTALFFIRYLYIYR